MIHPPISHASEYSINVADESSIVSQGCLTALIANPIRLPTDTVNAEYAQKAIHTHFLPITYHDNLLFNNETIHRLNDSANVLNLNLPLIDMSLDEVGSSYSKLAHQGEPVAMYNLGLMLYLGKWQAAGFSTRANDSCQQVLYWFEQASNKGVKEASFNIGAMHQSGIGLPEDSNANQSLAFDYFTQASKLGDARAMKHLAYAYRRGQGVAQDNQQFVN